MADVAFPSDTLATVRADFIRAVKRYSLVANGDLVTNTDNGANRYINQGQRYLDMRVDHPKLTRRRFKKRMAIGDIGAEIHGLISVDTIALIEDTVSRYDMTNLVEDAQVLKSWVGKPLSLWESAMPGSWAFNDIGLAPEHYGVAHFVGASADAVATGTETNTYAVTTAQDGTEHKIVSDTGVLEAYYEFNVSTIGNPDDVEVLMIGRLNGADDELTVSAYNWGTTTWDSITTLDGSDEVNNRTHIYKLDTSYVGTGANASKVHLQFKKSSGLTISTLYVDYLACGPSMTDYEDVRFTESEGYEGILFDTKMDKAYDLEVVGKFFSKRLDTDTDKSFWTIRHPDLLVLAAAYSYEREQRNTSGTRAALEVMQPLIEEIENTAIEQEMSGRIMRLEA
jgi:hypothetical protein